MAERSVKLASIRVELRNGLVREGCVSDNGRCSLAPTGVSGASGVPEAADTPGADEAATGGKEERDTLGLSW